MTSMVDKKPSADNAGIVRQLLSRRLGLRRRGGAVSAGEYLATLTPAKYHLVTYKDRPMTSLGKTTCRGRSGKTYHFRVYPLGAKLRKAGGVYVITTRSPNMEGGYRHVPLYVGQAEDFSKPVRRHRKADAFKQHGANCICVQVDASPDSRVEKRDDLIAAFHPVCNG
jgi:hypothetical protein